MGTPMNYAIVTAKLDPATKQQAQITAQQAGIPLSVVIKILLKDFIKTKTLVINARDEEPNTYLKSVMRQAEENYKKGNVSPAFDNAKDAIKYLEDQGI